MDKEIEHVLESIERSKIGVDESFDFKCRGCGKCCREREDIILTPNDVFKIAKYLGKSHEEVIKGYGEAYLGPSSHVPMLRLKPKGGNNRCPFLDGRKCQIHEAKPVVCAMYPIGRMIMAKVAGEPIEDDTETQLIYLNMAPICDHKHRTQTVREWLGKWNIQDPDHFFLEWHAFGIKMATISYILETKKVSRRVLDIMWNAIFEILYVRYDISQEFEPQFEESLKTALSVLEDILDASNTVAFSPEGDDADGE